MFSLTFNCVAKLCLGNYGDADLGNIFSLRPCTETVETKKILICAWRHDANALMTLIGHSVSGVSLERPHQLVVWNIELPDLPGPQNFNL